MDIPHSFERSECTIKEGWQQAAFSEQRIAQGVLADA
jgi:hypothetical protein